LKGGEKIHVKILKDGSLEYIERFPVITKTAKMLGLDEKGNVIDANAPLQKYPHWPKRAIMGETSRPRPVEVQYTGTAPTLPGLPFLTKFLYNKEPHQFSNPQFVPETDLAQARIRLQRKNFIAPANSTLAELNDLIRIYDPPVPRRTFVAPTTTQEAWQRIYALGITRWKAKRPSGGKGKKPEK